MKYKKIETIKYCIFSDESNYNTGRFHAISALSYIRDAIHDIKPTDSKDCLFIQLTDLLAGLAVYSYTEYNNFLIWDKQNSPQMSLFSNPIHNFSKAQKARFYFLNNFIRKFDIDMNKNHGLGTPAWKKSQSINFWLYSPQRIEDKAPQKYATKG